MTDEEINVAICKLRGIEEDFGFIGGSHIWEKLPDHINGIEALGHMHEAEKELMGDCEIKWHKYKCSLYQIIEPHRHVLHSTAKQRAIALLKTFNLYVG